MHSWGIQLIALLMLVSGLACAESLSIVYRPPLNLMTTLKQIHKGELREKFPQAYELFHSRRRSAWDDMSAEEWTSIPAAIFEVDGATGHVVIKIESHHQGNGEHGWVPVAPEHLPPWDPDKVSEAEHHRRLVAQRPLTAAFSDWDGWKDRELPMETHTIRIEANRAQIDRVLLNVRRLSSDPNKKYQLPIIEARFDRDCSNCVTVLNEAFAGTGIVLDFVPAGGQLLLMHRSVEESAPTFPGCQHYFRKIAGQYRFSETPF